MREDMVFRIMIVALGGLPVAIIAMVFYIL
jgi:hypothetical protein